MTAWQFIVGASVLLLMVLTWLAKRYFPLAMEVRTITTMGLLVALGTVAAPFLFIPVGPAKAYPVQHAINVVAAVMLGPVGSATVALFIGILRNLFGLGTVLALPGGVIGAFLAGLAYGFFKSEGAAVIGEVFGTGVLGALLGVPLVRFLLGQRMAAFALVGSFALSSAVGAGLAFLLVRIIPPGFLQRYRMR